LSWLFPKTQTYKTFFLECSRQFGRLVGDVKEKQDAFSFPPSAELDSFKDVSGVLALVLALLFLESFRVNGYTYQDIN
jgi:hypothetical protein